MGKEVITRDIGSINNYYGGVCTKTDGNGNYFWTVENYNGDNWVAIPKYLYDTLLRYEKSHSKLKKARCKQYEMDQCKR